MTISILTLSRAFGMIVLLQTIGTCLHLRQFRDVPGTRYLIYGNIVFGLAGFASIFRYWHMSSQAAVFACNLMLILGISLFYVGLARFIGKRENLAFVLGVLAAFAIGFAYFTFFNDRMNLRIVVFSIVFCLYTGIGVIYLFKYVKSKYPYSVAQMTLMLLLIFIISVARIAAAVFGFRAEALYDPMVLQTWLFIAGIAIAVIWTFVVILMLNERTIKEKNDVQSRMRKIYNAIPEMIFITDVDAGILFEANKRFYQKLGFTPEETVGKRSVDIGIWGGEQDRRDFVERVQRDGKVENYEMLVRKRDGTVFTALLSSHLLELGNEKHIISVFRDIDERKRLMNELELQARTDTLTGISNRRYFLDTIRHEIDHSRSTGSQSVFLMLDIDHFKRINDNYGHQLGDIVISMVAQATKSALRASDILGRIGGDEFGVLLVNTDPAATEKIAEKIRRKVECLEMNADANTPIRITVSVGLAKYRIGDDAIEDLIARADKALYQAKEEGRNRVVTNW